MYLFHKPFFESLQAFYEGYRQGLSDSGDSKSSDFLYDFSPWLAKQFRCPLPAFGWFQLIAECEADDSQRVRIFVDYFLQYLDQKEEIEQADPANRHPSGTSGMAPADSASRAGAMPEASGDS